MQQEVYGEVVQGEIVGVEPVIPTATPVTTQPGFSAEVELGAYKGFGEVAPAPRGSIEFAGLWIDKGDRAMPIKMGVQPGGDTTQVRRAFATLVGELMQNGTTSGILAAQSSNQMHWSANPSDTSYQRHGFIGMAPHMASHSTWSGRTHQHEGITFDGFDGVIDVLGGDWQNAVYRVTLPPGGLDERAIGALGAPRPLRPEDLYSGPRNDGLLSTDEISGNYCCCCFPLGFGATTVMPHGPDVIEQWGWCWFTTLCLGGEVRVRNPGTNSFRLWKDPNNVTTFTPGGASNGPSCLCKTGSKASPPLTFELVDTKDIEGSWCCCCWMHTIAWSCFRKAALDKDKLNHSGCAWILLLPLLPFNEVRTRLYVNGHPTNGFVSPTDPNNIDWYSDSGCVGNGPSCSRKC